MPGCDSEAARLLPWFVTGRLEPQERARVEAHLAQCAACRADLAAETLVHTAVRHEPRVAYSPEPSLQKLMHRIDELERELPVSTPPQETNLGRPSQRAPVSRWLVAALVVQTVGLGWLGSQLWDRSSMSDAPAAYRTLDSATSLASPPAQVRVVFAPGTTIDEVVEVVRAADAQIVGGPSESGAYALSIGSGSLEARLALLRRDARIVFAEPIAGDSPARR
jgi:anti-sigma factor RsiW